MKSNKSLITAALTAMVLAQMTMVPSYAYANAGSATLSLSERATAWWNRTVRSTSKQKALAEEAGIETDPAKVHARDKSTANGDLRREYKADESILKATNAKVYDEAYLASKPGYIGRDEKIHEAVVRLNDGNKPNLLITGEAGAGKTSIVRQISRYLHQNWRLIDKMGKPKIIEIEVSSLVSGTTYRGEMEEKVNALLNYLKKEAETTVLDERTGEMVPQTIVLYIDEIHQLMGAGRDSSGSTGVAEMFKPFLSDGTFGSRVRVIGSTTRDEAGHLMKDPAVARRMGTPIDLGSPTTSEAIAMVQDNAARMEAYYGVRFPREMLEMFVHMSEKYIKGLVLPDPALDMMNRAGAAFLVDSSSSSTVQKLKSRLQSLSSEFNMNVSRNTAASRLEAEKLSVEIQALTAEMGQAEKAWSQGRQSLMTANKKITKAEGELKDLEKQHVESVSKTEANDRAGIARNADLIEKIEIKKQELRAAIIERKGLYTASRENLPTLTREQALTAVAGQIPSVERAILARSLPETMRVLRDELPRSVPGQASALARAGRAMSAGLKGLKMGSRPRAVLMLADDANQAQDTVRAIDQLVYGARNTKEVREAHVKTLIVDFAQPGSGRDFEQIKAMIDKRPHRAIAFLNIERADQTTLARLVEAAQTGHVELGNFADSRVVDFSDSVLLFHYGLVKGEQVQAYTEMSAKGMTALLTAVTQAFKSAGDKGVLATHFAALLSHSDSLIHLRKPSWLNLARIIERRVSDLSETLKSKLALSNPVTIKINRRGVAYRLAQEANDVDGIDALLEREVLGQLNALIDAGQIQGGEILDLAWDGQRFVLQITR